MNVKSIRKTTLFSHLLIFVFIFLFVKFAERLPYIYETNNIKNTGSIVLDLLFAIILIIHFILVLINFMVIFQKINSNENLLFTDILWSIYPIFILLLLSGFNMSNFINFIKSPFNMVMNSICLYR